MLVKPAAAPSIRYISVPATTAIEPTATRKTVTLGAATLQRLLERSGLGQIVPELEHPEKFAAV